MVALLLLSAALGHSVLVVLLLCGSCAAGSVFTRTPSATLSYVSWRDYLVKRAGDGAAVRVVGLAAAAVLGVIAAVCVSFILLLLFCCRRRRLLSRDAAAATRCACSGVCRGVAAVLESVLLWLLLSLGGWC